MNEWSPVTIAALAAAGAMLIGAFFAGIVSVINAWRSVAGKVSAIDAHVNSEKTASAGRESTLRAENALLREMVTEQKVQQATQAAATRVRSAIGQSATATLDKIEANTAATADGVQHLKETP